MGRASKWFRGLLGFKKPDPNADPAQRSPSKKRWSFSKGKDRRKSQHGVVPGGHVNDDEAGRHAIAVAAATAAVAEAAVAAAHAAAAVVQLTSAGGFDRPSAYGYGSREERAAVVIQSHFRAYLSRRALRALRALVRLQALVRGRIQRKQNADRLRQLQALVRVQVGLLPVSEALHSRAKPSRFSHHTARASPEKVDHRSRKHEKTPMMSKRNGSRSSTNISHDPERSPLIHHWMDDERGDKILEVDTGKPNTAPKRRTLFTSPNDQCCQSFYSAPPQATCLSPSSGEVQSLDVDESPFYIAINSPQYYYASSVDGSCKRAPFTPAKSDGSRSCMSGCRDHPSYMAYTESSKAKARSLSAPRQRPQWERTSSVNRYPVPGLGDQRCSTLQASFSLKAYPGSGRLDRLGVPVRDVAGFSGGLCHRY